MNQTPGGYSAARSTAAAQALRCGGPGAVRAARRRARATTLSLIDAYVHALGPALVVPRTPELNPPLWEWGHVAWFQQWWTQRNLQRDRGAACDPAHARPPSDLPGADGWYDSSRVPHDARWQLALPGLSVTLDWLERTQARTLALLDELPPDASDDALYFFRLVCLHEAMHAEAACYMARSLGFEVPLPPAVITPGGAPQCLAVPAMDWTLGSTGPGFAFDNELRAHTVKLQAFEIDDRLVSWSRFRAFAQAGGYEQPRWWSDEGWAWRQQARPAQPGFPEGDAPAVHVSAHEADAWCRWAGRRLPTEAEWECAAHVAPGFAWGHVWEWTASPFLPYPGFAPHPYRDYSQPWFGSRRVLRGACDATSDVMAHRRYRNFFEPGRCDIFAGFRSCA